jgi:hypothetical protein
MTLTFFPGGAAAGDGRCTRTSPGIRARRGAALFCLRTIGWLGMSWLCIPAGQATTLDIPVFAGGYGTAFYEETARQFEALRPGVKVNIYGDPRISDKLRVRMIDGNLPDAALPRDLLIPALAHAGKLRDLTPAGGIPFYPALSIPGSLMDGATGCRSAMRAGPSFIIARYFALTTGCRRELGMSSSSCAKKSRRPVLLPSVQPASTAPILMRFCGPLTTTSRDRSAGKP